MDWSSSATEHTFEAGSAGDLSPSTGGAFAALGARAMDSPNTPAGSRAVRNCKYRLCRDIYSPGEPFSSTDSLRQIHVNASRLMTRHYHVHKVTNPLRPYSSR